MTTPSEPLSPVKRAILEIRQLKDRIEQFEREASEPIAVIGIGCRFPGSDGPDAYWRLLAEGTDAIGEVPKQRWNADALFNPDPDAPGAVYTRHGGYLDQVDGFDAAFFGISPREATSLDPQQRLLLEVAWEALEHGGQAADRLLGSRSGVFIGICSNEYGSLQLSHGRPSELDAYYGTGNAMSVAAGRLSYFFGWRGPSMAIDAACSSSLVAVHLACQSLRQHECRMALAGGVNLLLRAESTINFCRARMLAPDGRCKTFDAAADGYSRGEGAAIVVLKRLSHALEDHDRVLGLILGSAVNQDGRSGGLTVPNGPSQEAVIRDALERARVQPRDVSYVEAHGTGTPLGDPIEVHSLCAVFGPERPPDEPLRIGSVKTNLGHLEAAAGVAGLAKVILSLQHGEIPKQLHFSRLNPHIDLGAAPVEVVSEPRAWPALRGRRIAGVSAFGFSGTNAHVVVGEAPPSGASAPASRGGAELVVLSARTPDVLRLVARRLADRLTADPALELADVAYTLATGRAHLAARAGLIAGSLDDLRRQLHALADAAPDSPPVSDLVVLDPQRPLVLCAGAAPGDAARVAALCGHSPAFAAAVDHLVAALRPPLGDVVETAMTTPDTATPDTAAPDSQRAAVASFIFQYAMAEMLRSWGLTPGAVSGCGTGAHVAAALAGAISPGDAARLLLAPAAADVVWARPHTAIRSADSVDVNGADLSRWLRQEHDRPSPVPPLAAAGALRIGGAATTPDAWDAVLRILDGCFRANASLDWAAVYGVGRRRLALPTYPFQRQRYWSAAAEAAALSPDGSRGVHLASTTAASPIENVRGRVVDALPSERHDVLVAIVRDHVRAVLRLDAAADVDRRHRLIDLGLDSLMVVELRNRIGVALAMTDVLPATLVFDYPTIEAVAAFLERQLSTEAVGVAPTHQPMPDDGATPSTIDEIMELSDAEAEALLREKLGTL